MGLVPPSHEQGRVPADREQGRAKASLIIAAEFRSRIAAGELVEGQPLPVESALVDELGVSKAVVREALRILETEGLVEVRRGVGGGPRVRHPSVPEVAKGMGVYLQIGDVLVTDVWETRDRIVGAAVERLAASGRPDAHEALEVHLSLLEDAVGHFEDFWPRLMTVGEAAVLATGSGTEHLIVLSLRHIVAAELAAATRSITDIDEAVGAEVEVARRWREVARHVKSARPRPARNAHDSQAALVRDGLWSRMEGLTVGEAIGRSRRGRRPPLSRQK